MLRPLDVFGNQSDHVKDHAFVAKSKKVSFIQSSLSKLVLIVSFMKVSVGRSLDVHVDKKLNTLLINYTGGILSSVS